MYRLYHYPICPLSRQVRVLLNELNKDFSLIKQNPWEKNPTFISLNPAGLLPILKTNNFNVIGIYPILEYLSESYHYLSFHTREIFIKCEIRRVIDWFNIKFYREVTKIIIEEKVIRRFTAPSITKYEYLKVAKNNLKHHLEYASGLLENRSFIAYEELSYADIVASTHFSTLDYFGEINWDLYPVIKDWYSIIKSRPSYRAILHDTVPGFKPSITYGNLDF